MGGRVGVNGPQDLHSAVNLSHKSLSELLEIGKEYHYRAIKLRFDLHIQTSSVSELFQLYASYYTISSKICAPFLRTKCLEVSVVKMQ